MSTITLPAPCAHTAEARRHRHRPRGPGAWHQPLQPAPAAAAVPLAQGRVRRQLHRTRRAADDLLRRLLHRAGLVGILGRPLRTPAHPLCGPGADRLGGPGLRGQHQLLDAGGFCGAGRRGQRRVPPGGLHAAQPQGGQGAAGPCLQRAWHHRQPGLGAGACPAGTDRAGQFLACGAGVRGAAGLCGAAGAADPQGRSRTRTRSARTGPDAGHARGGQLRFPAHPGGVDVLRLLLLLRRRA